MLYFTRHAQFCDRQFFKNMFFKNIIVLHKAASAVTTQACPDQCYTRTLTGIVVTKTVICINRAAVFAVTLRSFEEVSKIFSRTLLGDAIYLLEKC